ncbi:hypothetical protein MTR67_044556 [Solanum verrucosum]|uniref:Uncharacterized protein n=1 Tax=Solanum verrucosum TaxID=315347 RepID=A0AAF0UTL0_SOLVR|nr:hypothetical protein MTR67_044556 [Solanum verrucosum]
MFLVNRIPSSVLKMELPFSNCMILTLPPMYLNSSVSTSNFVCRNKAEEPTISGEVLTRDELIEESTETAVTNESIEAVVPRIRSQRETKTPGYLDDFVCNVVIALAIPYWHIAMQEELETLKKNDTWSLVPRKVGMNVIGSK